MTTRVKAENRNNVGTLGRGTGDALQLAQWSAESELVVQTYDPATQAAETIGSPV